jgi:hypothetical protein
MCTPLQFEQFHVLLIRRGATEVLLHDSSRGARLPVLTVPAKTRIAEELTRSVRDSLGLTTYCLLTLPIEDSLGRAAVLEVTSPSEQNPGELQWRNVASLSEADFDEKSDFGAMRHSIRSLDRYRLGEVRGTFAKPGCLQVVTDWVQEQIAPMDLRLNGQFRQLNAGPSFSLLRFETNGPALWFKAVGEPSVREYGVTLTLARSFPTFLPRILGHCKEWNAWLALEATGSHPDANPDLGQWLTVVRELAHIQLASFGQALHLLEAGCKDLRTHSLLDQIDPFLEAMSELMERQTKETPARATRGELQRVGAQLREALSTIEDAGLPDTLGHLDCNPGNLVVDEERCVFLDWNEAYAGHPIFTLQYLLEHVRRLPPANASWESQIRAVYTHAWQPFFEPHVVNEALASAPLLAVFAYSVSGNAWHNLGSLSSSPAAHLRSLTRRIVREGHLHAKRWMPCVS